MALLVAVMLWPLAGMAESARAESPGVETPAHFAYFVFQHSHTCMTEFGIEFTKVHGAASYTVRFRQPKYGLETLTDLSGSVAGWLGPPFPPGRSFVSLAGSGAGMGYGATCKAGADPYTAMYSDAQAFAVPGNCPGDHPDRIKEPATESAAAVDLCPPVIDVSFQTTPKQVMLKVDKKGNVEPGKVTVKVIVTNTSKRTVDNVRLVTLGSEPVDPTQQLDRLEFPKGAVPVVFKDSFPPHSHASKTFTLDVKSDGEYQFRALALYDDPNRPGGNGRSVGIGGKFESVVPFLWYKAQREDENVAGAGDAATVKGGNTWYVSGELRNLSSYQTLCVLPMLPSAIGNAQPLGPANILEKNVRQSGGAYAGTLIPGQKVSLQMFVDTSATGTTRSGVEVAPEAVKIKRGAKCNQSSVAGISHLKGAEKSIVGGSTDFAVKIDTSDPLLPPSDRPTNTFNFFGGFGRTLFTDSFEGIYGIFALDHAITSSVQQFSQETGLPKPLASAALIVIKARQMLYTATDVYASYWRTASEQEKNNAYYRVGNVIANISNDFFDQSVQTVRETAEPFMAELEKAHATGDDATVWKLYGEIGGHVAAMIIPVFMHYLGGAIVQDESKLQQASKAATKAWEESPEVEAITEEAGVQSVPPSDLANLAEGTTLKTVPAGAELTTRDVVLWGQDAETDAKFSEIAEKCECLIGVRSRSEDAIGKLENGSVWKHEQLKPKNVNQIDVDWLGFRDSDLSEVRFRTYTSEQKAAIDAAIEEAKATLSPSEYADIIKRRDTRFGEYKYVETIEGFSKKGQINVGFNYRDNGINIEATSKLRKFDLVSTDIPAEKGIPAGGTYYTPYQENPAAAKAFKKGGPRPKNCIEKLLSLLCTVTGDMDGVYITNLNGGPLSKEKMIEVYAALQEAGWQHPETLTWIKKNLNPEAILEGQTEFLFGAKSAILDELQYGTGQAMIEYAPGGVRRATYLDMKQSQLITRDQWQLHVVGGYTQFVAAAK